MELKTNEMERIIKNKRAIKHSSILLLMALVGVFFIPSTAYLSGIKPENIIKLTNLERIKAGLDTLEENPRLADAALAKAGDIFDLQDFSHNPGNKKFTFWIKESGYEYFYAGENLAIDFVSAEGVVKAWMDSPSHKENILKKEFSEIGIAVVEGSFRGENTVLIVQIFGAPAKISSVAGVGASVTLEKSEIPVQTGQFPERSDKPEAFVYPPPSPATFLMIKVLPKLQAYPEIWALVFAVVFVFLLFIHYVDGHPMSHRNHKARKKASANL